MAAVRTLEHVEASRLRPPPYEQERKEIRMGQEQISEAAEPPVSKALRTILDALDYIYLGARAHYTEQWPGRDAYTDARMALLEVDDIFDALTRAAAQPPASDSDASVRVPMTESAET